MTGYRVRVTTDRHNWTTFIGTFETLPGAEAFLDDVIKDGWWNPICGWGIERCVDGQWRNVISVEQGAAS